MRKAEYEYGYEGGFEAGQRDGYNAGQKTGYEAGQKTGYEAGQKSGINEVIVRMIRSKKYTIDDIAEVSGVSVKEIRKIAESIE